mmetsp:Transcript_14417/g.23834  ORF Transcript_14417/g.23834 Transcript_14417/m.23834 type:complete len:999 (-) Transcript_14417:258-3254(-)
MDEECTHDVQFHGLCAACGKDLTNVEGTSDTSKEDRLPLVRSHPQLLVRRQEAVRIEREAAIQLLGRRKLWLVLDLDHTLLHATTGPFAPLNSPHFPIQQRHHAQSNSSASNTSLESHGQHNLPSASVERRSDRRSLRKSKSKQVVQRHSSLDLDTSSSNPSNIIAKAPSSAVSSKESVQTDAISSRDSVQTDSSEVQHRNTNGVSADSPKDDHMTTDGGEEQPVKGTGSEDVTDADKERLSRQMIDQLHEFILPGSPVKYFVKLRPGLFEFLAAVHELFELHIYTMGTRSYACKIADIIDPSHKYFSERERIASREDCGDMNFKNLQKLFPCDDSMVLIVDDREDVWQNCPNLIKVEPYMHFVGGHEVNNVPGTSLLPPNSHMPAPSQHPHQHPLKNHSHPSNPSNSQSSSDRPPSLPPPSVEHPLPPPPTPELSLTKTQSPSSPSPKPPPAPPPMHPPMPLVIPRITKPPNQQDDQLQCILRVITQVHKRFFEQVDNYGIGGLPLFANGSVPNKDNTKRRRASLPKVDGSSADENDRTGDLANNHSPFGRPLKRKRILNQSPTQPASMGDNDPEKFCDVKAILKTVKTEVLGGVHCVFSGVFPTNIPPQSNDIWKQAEAFGAQCHLDINSSVTHLIAVRPGTAKVTQAASTPGMHIVSIDWLYQSTRNWKHMDELEFPLKAPRPPPKAPGQSDVSDPQHSSSSHAQDSSSSSVTPATTAIITTARADAPNSSSSSSSPKPSDPVPQHPPLPLSDSVSIPARTDVEPPSSLPPSLTTSSSKGASPSETASLSSSYNSSNTASEGTALLPSSTCTRSSGEKGSPCTESDPEPPSSGTLPPQQKSSISIAAPLPPLHHLPAAKNSVPSHLLKVPSYKGIHAQRKQFRPCRPISPINVTPLHTSVKSEQKQESSVAQKSESTHSSLANGVLPHNGQPPDTLTESTTANAAVLKFHKPAVDSPRSVRSSPGSHSPSHDSSASSLDAEDMARLLEEELMDET